MKRFVNWILYITSLFPLFLLLGFQNFKLPQKREAFFSYVVDGLSINLWNGMTVHVITMWLLLLFSLISLLVFIIIRYMYAKLSLNRKDDHVTLPILSNYSIDRVDTMSYVGTYIVPMLTIETDSVRSVLVNALLLIILGKFYVMNGQVFINPLFNLGNFGVYRSEENYFITKIGIDNLKGMLSRDESLRSYSVSSGQINN